MPTSTINKVQTIVRYLPLGDASIIPIYEVRAPPLGREYVPGHFLLSFNSFVKNLRAYGAVGTLATSDLPRFELEDSDSERLRKTLDIEWKSPRKQLNMFIAVSGTEWLQVGSMSLLNPYGYPFRAYNLMDFFTDNLALELGGDGKIGIQIEDVGWGLLQQGDRVTIHGSAVEEIFVRYDEPQPHVSVQTPDFVIDPRITIQPSQIVVQAPDIVLEPKITVQPPQIVLYLNGVTDGNSGGNTPRIPTTPNSVISNSFVLDNNSIIGNI